MSSFDRIIAGKNPAADSKPALAGDVEAQARATWARDPAVRHEFISEANFLAYEKARSRGAFRVLRTRGES